MTDELMEQRMAELNAHNAEKSPIPDNEKRAYSVDDIMAILDISRSSAYILIKKNLFRSVKIGNQLRISKASFDEWVFGCQGASGACGPLNSLLQLSTAQTELIFSKNLKQIFQRPLFSFEQPGH